MGDIIGGITSGIMQRGAGDDARRRARRATQAGVSELQPTQRRGEEASNFIANLLGMGDDPGAGQEALRQFRESTGFQDRLRRGREGITGSMAAQGLLDSGATARALQDRGQQMASESLNNFIAQLMGLSQQGVGASSNIANMRQQGGITGAGMGMEGDLSAAQSFGDAAGGVDLTQLLPLPTPGGG